MRWCGASSACGNRGGRPEAAERPQAGGTPQGERPEAAERPQAGGTPQGGRPEAAERPQAGGTPQGGRPEAAERPQAGGTPQGGRPEAAERPHAGGDPDPTSAGVSQPPPTLPMVFEELLIRDVGVIEDVTLRLEPGLNVVTGETGAGKTIVVSALELLLGSRADTSQVRAGAAAAAVEGRLRPAPPDAHDWLGEGDDELVVAREVAAEGRSRARLGGRLAPASALAEVLGRVVEIHGQHEAVRLTTPSAQRELLDRAGGPELAPVAAHYHIVYERWRAAREELAMLRADERDRARELDRLRFEVAEIEAVAPHPGEEAAVESELTRLEHAEMLTEAAGGAAAALVDEGGARDGVGVALGLLRGASGVDEALDELGRRAVSVAAEVQELALDLNRYGDGVSLDPARLDHLRHRRAALAALIRKYGPDMAGVATYADEARQRVAALESGEDRATALAETVGMLERTLGDAALALREARYAAGHRLARLVEGHLEDLALAEARMEVRVEPVDPGPAGADRVAFLLAPNPGEPAAPLAKAASGGERSRVALAVRLALADADGEAEGESRVSGGTPCVLVFDEVDAGIGGATALQVGRKLARLARGSDGAPRRQVLCVTHLPQLAAFADAHFLVSKCVSDGRTVASVRCLDEEERITELSRMLSGTPDSEVAAHHAAELRAAATSSIGL
jgi:DNA repair protein RecN (Recombination protein N)